MKTKNIGALGEDVACAFLKKKGFVIIERNYRLSFGEVDIIAKKGSLLHFVEVKTVTREISKLVSRENKHQPEDKVDVRKLEKLQKVSQYYLNSKRVEEDAQIDVVAVFIDPANHRAQCRITTNVL